MSELDQSRQLEHQPVTSGLTPTADIARTGLVGPVRAKRRLMHRAKLGGDHLSCDLVGPHLETDQRVRPERLGDRNVGGVAALCDQYAADPRHEVAGIERVPAAAEIGLEPAGEVATAQGWGVPMSPRYPVQ